MSAESDTDNTTAVGIESRFGWPIGGAVGGAVGAAAFGILMWLFDPDVVQAAIPSIYGLDAAGITGWAIHIAHGAVLGVIFAFLITRQSILGVIRTDVETDIIAAAGIPIRIVAAGFVFGLAIWAILPLLALPIWSELLGTEAAAEFPAVAVESLLGHLLFGTVLGAVFAVVINLENQPSHDTLAE